MTKERQTNDKMKWSNAGINRKFEIVSFFNSFQDLIATKFENPLTNTLNEIGAIL